MRIVTLLVRNWPLKLAAIGLATLLYAGIVLSQNVQTFTGQVTIAPIRQPANAVLVKDLPTVTNIRYVAPSDVAGRLTSSSFQASIDLGNAKPTADEPFVTVPVTLQAADGRVTILSFEPEFIRIQLDPLTTKTVPIQLEQGPLPSGLSVQPPVLSVQTAVVSGPDSVVRLAVAARAQVLIQSSGLDVHADVPLVAVDAVGNVLSPVHVEPQTVRVDITVGSQEVTRSVPVQPMVNGTPGAGYELGVVSVTPAVVTLQGDAEALAQLDSVDTKSVSVAGATSTVRAQAGLALPDGIVSLSGNEVTVTATVRQVTATRTFSTGLVLAGARDDRRYSLSTDAVTVTIGGPATQLDAIAGQTLTGTLDVGGLAIGPHDVRVQINLPSGLRIVSISPPTVTVTVAAVAPSPTPTPPSPSPSTP